MQNLRKYIRKLMMEGMMTPHDIAKLDEPEDYYLSPKNAYKYFIAVDGMQSMTMPLEPRGEAYMVSLTGYRGDGSGYVSNRGTVEVDYNHECKTFEVINAYSNEKNLGPLLYDIAIEIAGETGLMCDRHTVSADAENVWKKYVTTRYDVTPSPLPCKWNPRDNRRDINLDVYHDEKYGWSKYKYFKINDIGKTHQPVIKELYRLNRIKVSTHQFDPQKYRDEWREKLGWPDFREEK